MRSVNIAVLGALLSLSSLPARADVLVQISKAQQQLTVTVNGVETYRWRVSTGKPGYTTPSGGFRAFRLEEVYFSKKYDDAPMPNAVFFHEGYAVHGTLEQSKLGRPVSHGCVRLSREHAATLFALVKQQGLGRTRIVVSDARLASRLPDPAVTERAEAAAERAAARHGGQQIQSARVNPDLPPVTKPVVAPVVQAAPAVQATPLVVPPPQEQRTVARAVEPERDVKPDRGFQQWGAPAERPAVRELGPDIKRVPTPARIVEEPRVKRSRQAGERTSKPRQTVDARRERAKAAAGQQAVARQDRAPVRRAEASERESRLRAIYRKYGFTW
ncbi:MAG: L,D-transpeptidase [Pseudolabrys sp.]